MQKTLSSLRLLKTIANNEHIVIENFQDDYELLSGYILSESEYNEVSRITILNHSFIELSKLKDTFLEYLTKEGVEYTNKGDKSIIVDNYSNTNVKFTTNLVDLRTNHSSIIIVFMPIFDKEMYDYMKVLYHKGLTKIICIGGEELYRHGFVKVWHEQ